MRNLAMIAAACLSLAGCTFGHSKDAAEAAVVEFHQMLDAGRFHEIYAGASDDLHRMATEAEFSNTLQLIHDRLGSVRQTSESDWRIDFAGGGDMVQIHYATQFASGRGDEEFVYRISGGAARLAGYHVRSPNLRTGAAASEGNSTAPPSTAANPSEETAPQSTVRLATPEPAKPPEPEPEPAGGK